MNILVTGAKGFVGKNLCAQLKNIKDGKVRYYGGISVDGQKAELLWGFEDRTNL